MTALSGDKPPAADKSGPDGPHFQNLTTHAMVTLIIAVLSALIGAVIGVEQQSRTMDAAVLFWVLPPLIVVALMSTGLRILGDLVALPISLFLFVVGALSGLLGGHSPYGGVATNPPAMLLAIVQIGMFFSALIDLWRSRKIPYQSVAFVNRLVGLAVPVAVYFLAWGIIALGRK